MDINLWRYLLNKYVMFVKINIVSVFFNFGMVNKDLINLLLILVNVRVNNFLKFKFICIFFWGKKFYF